MFSKSQLFTIAETNFDRVESGQVGPNTNIWMYMDNGVQRTARKIGLKE